jgi:hypothetical protein
MITNTVGLVTRAAWVGWLLIGFVALLATYGPWDVKDLPKGTPQMKRVVIPGAQDSSAAMISLVRFTEVSGFGQRWPLQGGMQLAPIPGFLALLIALMFVDVSVRGPKVVRHRDH